MLSCITNTEVDDNLLRASAATGIAIIIVEYRSLITRGFHNTVQPITNYMTIL